jgi:hypothetical protein
MELKDKLKLEILQKAVEQKNYVKFKYENEEIRIVAPYVAGEFNDMKVPKEGKAIKETNIGIRAYFVSGYTSRPIKKEMDKCKRYIIEKMENLELVVAKDKSNKNNYNGEDKGFSKIYFKRSVY